AEAGVGVEESAVRDGLAGTLARTVPVVVTGRTNRSKLPLVGIKKAIALPSGAQTGCETIPDWRRIAASVGYGLGSRLKLVPSAMTYRSSRPESARMNARYRPSGEKAGWK